jgi:hypothetical protein
MLRINAALVRLIGNASNFSNSECCGAIRIHELSFQHGANRVAKLGRTPLPQPDDVQPYE